MLILILLIGKAFLTSDEVLKIRCFVIWLLKLLKVDALMTAICLSIAHS